MSDPPGQLNPQSNALLARDALYKALLETGEADSAKNIWKACEYLSKIKARKITASSVASYCVTHFGGPQAQSIANKQSTLAELVRLWDTVYRESEGGKVARSRIAKARYQTNDPAAAAIINILEEEIGDLKRANRRLSDAFASLSPINTDSMMADSYSIDHIAPNGIERDAILNFLGAKFLKNLDLFYDEKGRITDGLRVFVERPVIAFLKRAIGGKGEGVG